MAAEVVETAEPHPKRGGGLGGLAFLRRLAAFSGPGYMVAVGYMDPGNWATDLGGGSAYGYTLLSVVLLSSLAAMLLQALAVRLGIATGRDLAQACREHYGPRLRVVSWALCELAIVACDLAEVVGTAIALQLLFHLPLIWGVCLTTLDTFLLLALRRAGARALEALVVSLMALIAGCFGLEMWLSHPSLIEAARGFAPSAAVVTQPGALFLAIGVMGATIMPHNLYLHSSLVQSRDYPRTPEGRRGAALFATIDSSLALGLAMFVNAAILILAAAAFHRTGHTDVAEIQDAYRLLTPLLGTALAAPVFAVALLASGQNSSITATLAGQIVMEGFLNLRINPYLRRILTRLTAAVPAVLVVAWFGDRATGQLLIWSQVLLSLQLPFAIWPLIRFTSDKAAMGDLASPPWLKVVAWSTAAAIIALNVKLVLDVLLGHAA